MLLEKSSIERSMELDSLGLRSDFPAGTSWAIHLNSFLLFLKYSIMMIKFQRLQIEFGKLKSMLQIFI